jgi:branched-chain amino acid transport system ATP-binding protein
MLTVENIHVGYGRIPILKGISFTVGEHEAVGIMGHNGMGKTTLLKALMGQLPLTKGNVGFRGRDVSREPSFRRARAGIGFVPQGRAIFPALSVYENLRMGHIDDGIHSETNAVKEMLARFPRLDPIIDRAGGALSGGEQQILALARALCGRPRLLLLDEPTEGIQPSIVDEIGEILKDLHQQQGLSIVVVEQGVDFIRSLSDRVLGIEKGIIAREGLASEMKESMWL